MIVNDLKAYYATRSGDDVKAVDGVTLSINEGEIFGIVGESGCGKSTLAAVISLTAPPNLKILGGEMALNDSQLSLDRQHDVPTSWHGKMVALLPQRAMNSLNPTARVRNIAIDVMRAHNPKLKPREAIKQTQERLELLGLPVRVIDSYPHQLSGGMRQRVVAVISTLLNPSVLIADEPTSALDVSSQKQLISLLKQLLKRSYIGRVVFITHDLPMLSNFADRIAVMYAGKIVEVGTTDEIVNRPKHPYTQALINSTLDLNLALRGKVIAGIPGAPPDLRHPPNGCYFHPRCSKVMEICAQEDPPFIGDDQRSVTCWWVKEQLEPVKEAN